MPRICWKLIGEFLNSARENDVAELRLLLDACPILINALDAQGQNALSVAGGREAIDFLVENGAVDPAATSSMVNAALPFGLCAAMNIRNSGGQDHESLQMSPAT